MRKKINLIIVIITLIILSTTPLFYHNTNEINDHIKPIKITNTNDIKSFSSYNELSSFITSRYSYKYPVVSTLERASFSLSTFPMSTVVPPALTAEQSSYSKTNIQVEGVDELDIVKTDGKYLYIALKNIIYIIMAYPPHNATISSKIILDKNIMGIFLFNNKLAAILSDWNNNEKSYETSIKVYDITNKNTPILIKDFTINGYYFTSRSISNYIYLIVKIPIIKPTIQYWKQYVENFDLDQFINIPEIKFNGLIFDLPVNQIYYFPSANETYYEYTTIIAFNVVDNEMPTIGTFLLGDTNNLYMSLNNLYITSPKWETIIKTSNKFTLITRLNYEKSIIYRFSVNNNDIKYETNSEVPGTILNQFSMDEFNSYFRIVTTIWKEKPENNLYILDVKNMRIVGNITGLAPGEWIYSARFIGNRCYLVTFKKTDPLFVIDIKNPSAPKVLGWLKIPGFSNYLHPYDETHLIGIGKDTIEAKEGDFAWYQGIKISLFDVSDPQNPKEVTKYIIGDRGSDSPVLHDHKALLFDPVRKILALPVLITQKDNPNAPPYEYGKPVWQGAYIFNVSLNQGLILIGRISHLNKTGNIAENLDLRQYFVYNEDYFIKRIIYINDAIYTISNRIVLINNLTNMTEINNIALSA
jgi:uncharacterized secreted protein with C-terminal beta-propeller domain